MTKLFDDDDESVDSATPVLQSAALALVVAGCLKLSALSISTYKVRTCVMLDKKIPHKINT